jgi:uncharacterized LabA/DUF88 family protein
VEQNLAVLIDFENIAAGVDKEKLGKVDIAAILRRLKVRGRIVTARSYADWGRFAKFKQPLLEQGVTMVELTSHGRNDKNRADIALVVDAMELAFTRDYIDTFVIISGDSDFTPLALRLKELNKRVIGVGTKGSTSKLLVQATDEFIFYDSLIKKQEQRQQRGGGRRRERDDRDDRDDREREREHVGHEDTLDHDQAFALLSEAIEGLEQDTEGWVLASIVKSAMTRREPSFSEGDLGYSSFGRFLEDGVKRGLASIRRDQRSGGYRVGPPGEQPEDDQPQQRSPSRQRRAEAPGLPSLGEEATELRDALAGEGLDPLTRELRAALVELTIALVDERSEKRRRTNLHTLRSELVRRVKQDERGTLTVNRARSVLRALREARVFLHADGTPVRSESAHFSLHPADLEGILDAMDSCYLRELSGMGLDEQPSSSALAELLLDDPDLGQIVEEKLAWLTHEATVPEEVEVMERDATGHPEE